MPEKALSASWGGRRGGAVGAFATVPGDRNQPASRPAWEMATGVIGERNRRGERATWK